MKKILPAVLLCAAVSLPVSGQGWTFGAGVGPFVFGDFVRRTLLTGNEGASGQQTMRLSASTRPGLSVDLEHDLGGDRFALRFEGTFTHAPIAIKGSTSQGVALDAGKINVGTFQVPLVVRINPRGSFRFHVLAGPAYAVYNIKRRSNATSSLSTFAGTRSRWGAALGGGVGWWWSQRFALEGQFIDLTTTSPFKRADFGGGPGARLEIPRTANYHTTIGIRYRF